MVSIPLNKILHQDCLEGLRSLPNNRIDCCVTDPPYGIRFMGKKWDYEIPGVPVWEEVLRVLKPGGHILVACGTRTQHRMAVNIEDAGFEIRDVICWHYGSGFPKSLDISKAIDKMGDQNKDYVDLSEELCTYLKRSRHALSLSTIQLGEHFKTHPDRINHGGCITNWERGHGLPTMSQWEKLKSILSLRDDRFISLIERAILKRFPAEREIVGTYDNDMGGFAGDRLGSSGGDITIAKTEEAIKWDGWGTALKPATEFWTLARKPLSEKTIAQNVIKHGTGALNIDTCRIESPDIEVGVPYTVRRLKPGATLNKTGGNWRPGEADSKTFTGESKSGRFPANLILDDFMAEEMDQQSGSLTSGKPVGSTKAEASFFGRYKSSIPITGYGDTGGASRFFYVAKPSAEERGDTKHPTVKPQTLIQYLIKLICPIEAGRIVLDPFAGSGSHCIAARKLGLDFVAHEREEHSCKEANDRLQKEMGLFGQEPPEDPDLCMNGGEY